MSRRVRSRARPALRRGVKVQGMYRRGSRSVFRMVGPISLNRAEAFKQIEVVLGRRSVPHKVIGLTERPELTVDGERQYWIHCRRVWL